VSDICIISCGARKVWKSDNSRKLVPAKDAYTGPLFKKCKEYAERFFPENWFIISDKYGLIRPDALISDYNISPDAVKGNHQFVEYIARQKIQLGITASIITTTSGKIHQDILNKAFPESSFQNPVAKLSQGKRLQKLNQLLNDGRKL